MSEEEHRCPQCSEYLDMDSDDDSIYMYYYWCPACGWEQGDDED